MISKKAALYTSKAVPRQAPVWTLTNALFAQTPAEHPLFSLSKLLGHCTRSLITPNYSGHCKHSCQRFYFPLRTVISKTNFNSFLIFSSDFTAWSNRVWWLETYWWLVCTPSIFFFCQSLSQVLDLFYIALKIYLVSGVDQGPQLISIQRRCNEADLVPLNKCMYMGVLGKAENKFTF